MNFLPQADTITLIAAIFPLGVLMMLGAFHLLLFLSYKRERNNLFFVILCLTLVLNSLSMMLPSIAVLNTEQIGLVNVLFRLSTTASGLTLMLAVYSTLYRGIPQKFYALILPLMALSLANAVFPSILSKWISLVVVTVLLTEVARTAWSAIKGRQEGAWILGAGALLFIGLSLYYWLTVLLRSKLTPIETAFFTLGDMLIMPVTLALWTAKRFAATHKNLERQTEEVRILSAAMLKQEQEKRENIERRKYELEQLVEERTVELQEQMDLLRSANEEIQRQVEIQTEQSAKIQLANTQLQEQNVRLHDLNQEKNEFLSIAAHDLKNPLSNIMMLTEMLRQPNMIQEEDKRVEAFELVISATRRMMTLIVNLLDINKIEQGNFSLNIISIDIASKARIMTDSCQTQAEKKNIRIECSAPAEAYIRADAVALSQIMDNLLSNALKYSPRGGFVRVRVEKSDTDGEGNSSAYIFSVQDEGQGLTEEDKTKLFGKFARLSAQPTDGEHSTGLGLSIVKRMVDAMQGRVWCESEAGKGATFFVELPAASSVEM
ncbi:MAG: hypothetical protein JNN25_04795 [Candidatus Kapabacteria bacterium]|nr:hypothetical protein [Candidatus Kapabacteria bacterium]